MKTRVIDTGIFQAIRTRHDPQAPVRSDRELLLSELDSMEAFARDCIDGIEQWRTQNQKKLRDPAWANWFGACQDDAAMLAIAVQHVRLALEQGEIETAALHAMSAGVRLTRLHARDYESIVRGGKVSGKNLRPPPNFISADRILEVTSDPRYPTRAAQAKALGYSSSRSLNKRISKLRHK